MVSKETFEERNETCPSYPLNLRQVLRKAVGVNKSFHLRTYKNLALRLRQLCEQLLNVLQGLTFWIQVFDKLFNETQFDLKGWQQPICWLHRRHLLHVIGPNLIADPGRPVLQVMKDFNLTILEAQKVRKLSGLLEAPLRRPLS